MQLNNFSDFTFIIERISKIPNSVVNFLLLGSSINFQNLTHAINCQ